MAAHTDLPPQTADEARDEHARHSVRAGGEHGPLAARLAREPRPLLEADPAPLPPPGHRDHRVSPTPHRRTPPPGPPRPAPGGEGAPPAAPGHLRR